MKDNTNAIASPDFIEVDLIEKELNKDRLLKNKGISLITLVVNDSIIAGYGRCRSCECKGYISKHNGSHECKNCNHHFDRHN